MSREYPDPRHQRGRALRRTRVPRSLQALQNTISERRHVTSDRFRQPLAWLRLVVLGILLVNLALLTFANTQFERNIGGYLPGMGFVFAGLLVGIIVLRIARPFLYLDWIASGLLMIVLGIMLGTAPSQVTLLAFVPFGFVFTILGMLKVWIGITFPPGKAAASLIAGGFVSLFCVAGVVVARVAKLGISVDTILAIDLTITGFSIICFGLALRPSQSLPDG